MNEAGTTIAADAADRATGESRTEGMPTGRALVILLAVVVAVGAYLVLTSRFGVHEPWVGFLFLLYWSGTDEMKPATLPRAASSAAAGIAIAVLPIWLTPLIGTGAALVAMLAVVLAAIFCLIKGIARSVVNSGTMLFLTVIAIPHISAAATPGDLYLGLAAGLVYFGGLRLIAAAIAARRTVPAA